MESDFLIAYNKTAIVEGGYVNDPADPGKETYKGIARAKHPNWQGWETIDSLLPNKAGMTSREIDRVLGQSAQLSEDIKAFYKAEFWDRLNLSRVRFQLIANEVYDSAVNLGTHKPATWLQRSLNILNRGGRDWRDLEVDGDIGPATLRALNNCDVPNILNKALNVMQGAEYIRLAERSERFERFIRGWLDHRVEINQ